MSALSALGDIVEAPVKITETLVQPLVEPLAQTSTGGESMSGELLESGENSGGWGGAWKSSSFLWLALILFLVLFIWAWVSYDPDQRIFTLYDIPQNGTYDFPHFSGQIIIHDGDQKGVTEWLVGGEVVKLVACSGGCSDPSDPSSGLLEYNADIDGYTWTQTKWADPTTYTFITNRIVRGA